MNNNEIDSNYLKMPSDSIVRSIANLAMDKRAFTDGMFDGMSRSRGGIYRDGMPPSLISFNAPSKLESRTVSFYEVEKAAGTQLVGMNEFGCIEFPADTDEKAKIATFGLGGCTAVAVVSEYPDGRKSGYIQHFDPLHKLVAEIKLHDHLEGGHDATSRRIVVMTPGDWRQDSEGQWAMAPNDELMVDNLLQAGNLQGSDDVTVYSYSCSWTDGRYGQGTLMIELGANPVMYTEMIPVKFPAT